MDEHPLLRFFRWDHLPAHLQAISQPFGELAEHLWKSQAIKKGDELTMALRKLLEAKDCAVRAAI